MTLAKQNEKTNSKRNTRMNRFILVNHKRLWTSWSSSLN